MRDRATGECVTVRAYEDEHIDALYTAVCESIPEVARYETWCRPGFTRDQAADYVNWWRKAWTEDAAFYFAVEDLRTGDFVGSCGLSDVKKQHGRAALGYWVRSGCTGRGLATDAARVVTRLGLEDLGLGRVEMEIAVDNGASLRIAEKLGFEREGVLRQRLILLAGATDMVMCALLRGDAG